MIWFTSDAHFGHRNIHKMGGRPVASPEENVKWICDWWQTLVSSKTAYDRADRVYCLGDMAFDDTSLQLIRRLNGVKFLLKGNHDMSWPTEYDTYACIEGMLKYKGMWLSHPPIHELELRGKPNIHGHVHQQSLSDPRYFNICPENLFLKYGRPIISLDELRVWVDSRYSPLHA